VTTTRRSLFALLGLVLPVAFTAPPVAAATSNSVQHKTASQHTTAATHKAKPQHSSHVQHASHHTTATHHASHKVASS
jgi:hypothetical protein